MVEPVVTICYIVMAVTVRGHTAQRSFTGIPQVVFGKSYPCGADLDIKGTIAFRLIGITSGVSVEKVNVMDPKVTVACIHGYTVVHTV